MSLHNVNVPLYNSSGENEEEKLTVDEFAGRFRLTLQSKGLQVDVECYFDDLRRAWDAVKR